MKLIRARVRNYMCIENSGWVDFENLTCLVGKNEAGKTAFLSALNKFKPVEEQEDRVFDLTFDYPKKRLAKYKKKHSTSPDPVVECEYVLDKADLEIIEADFGTGIIPNPKFAVKKFFDNTSIVSLSYNESSCIRKIVLNSSLSSEIKRSASKMKKLSALKSFLEGKSESSESAKAFLEENDSVLNSTLHQLIFIKCIDPQIPKFFYFDEYSVMKGTVSVDNLIHLYNTNNLQEEHKSLLAFLRFAGLELTELKSEQNREKIIADIEGAQNSISDEVFEYWSQNSDLRVLIELLEANPADPSPLNTGRIFELRIENSRHRATVSFDKRSKGFVWFFSFLAYFHQIEERTENVILLLDEPGLSLHARAQSDFLKFISDRLVPNHQVIYTTHSPFMVDLRRLECIRLVIDQEMQGTKVTNHVLVSDKDATFPLQAALGYDLAQSLFIGPHCLLLEGASDYLFLRVMSDLCQTAGLTGLDPRWFVTNTGGVDRIPAFISLIGANDISLAVVTDVNDKIDAQIIAARRSRHLSQKQLIRISSYCSKNHASIEDLFDEAFYLGLVIDSCEDLLPDRPNITTLGRGKAPIVSKINKHIRESIDNHKDYNHYKPADYLLRNVAKYREKISETVLKRFENLFLDVNILLG